MTNTHHIARLALMAALALPLAAPMRASVEETAAMDATSDNAMSAIVADSVALPLATSLADSPMPQSDEEAMADTVGKTRRNTATGFNAIDYINQRRYLNVGDDFKSGWRDNLYLELGIGMEKMVPPTNDYRYGTLTSYRFGVGKHLNRLNSVRLSMHVDLGFQDDNNLLLIKAGGRLDHLFNLSAYFDGYDPTRFFELSTVLGVGAQLSRRRFNTITGKTLEGHVGVQAKFHTGPQGYFALEPYVGLSTDQVDVSGDRNWRKYDVFYGANLSYIFFLDNNMSAKRRRKLIENRSSVDDLHPDSTLNTWQRPWFMEIAAGPHFMASDQLGTFAALGHETALSIGKWLSPVLGARLTGSFRSAKWMKESVTSSEPSYGADYERSFYKAYLGVRIDALFNPLGFSKNFTWGAPWGFHLLFGSELGRIVQYSSDDHLNTISWTYSLGGHFFLKLFDGVHAFVEPRYTWYNYYIPYYGDAARSYRCNDNGLSLNVGFSVTSATHRYVKRPAHAEPHSRFSVGVGGGTALSYNRSTLNGMGKHFNFEGWGEWHIDRLNGVRLSFEYISIASKDVFRYYDLNMDYPDRNYLRTVRRGVWNRRFGLGFVGLQYSFNLSEAFCPYSPSRLIDVSAFIGPAMAFDIHSHSELDSQERLQQGHTAQLLSRQVTGLSFAVNAGVRFTVRLPHGFGVYLSPKLYVWRWVNTPGVDYMEQKHSETLDIGVQYDF